MSEQIRGKVLVAGVGYSELGRDTGRSEGSLAVQAILGALEDAGFTPDDVDGLAAYPDRVSGPFEGPSIPYVQQTLNFRQLSWYSSFGMSGPAQLAPVASGVYAITSGAASVVVCYRAHRRQTARYYSPTSLAGNLATYTSAYRAPYGVPGGAAAYALWARRFMAEWGYTEQDLAAVVLNCRHHAQLNPRAAWYGHPLTIEDYFAAEYIASPLRILDCDYPIDGAVAVVLAASDRAPDLRYRPVAVDALSHAAGPALEWDQWPDMGNMVSRYVGEQLWQRTALTPADVDVAELYDGFSWFQLAWLQDLGLCAPGEGGDFLRSGAGRVGGRLPVCTDGGQLGEGRLHGMGKLAEAVLQLQGRCDSRQVADAQVAVACAGGGTGATALLLTAGD